MEDYEQVARSVSQSMWEDFAMHMDSSSFGEMDRIAAEANRMDEEMVTENEEIKSANEAVTEEAGYGNDVIIAKVTDETTSVNEVVIAAVTDGTTSGNEEDIEAVTDGTTSGNEEDTEAVTDEATCGSEEETSLSSGEVESPEVSRVKTRHFLSIEQFFFIEDLIAAVKENMRNEAEENYPPKIRHKKSLAFSRDFYFSPLLESSVSTVVSREGEQFISLIKESTPDDNICVFETCKERFIERYKPIPYTRMKFLNLCVAIAYLGIHCWTAGLDPMGESKAANCICSLLYEVLQRGTLDHSSWPKSYFQLE